MFRFLSWRFQDGVVRLFGNQRLNILQQSRHNFHCNKFRKNVRRLLFFFYKEVHPDLTTNLPNDLKKINNESLSVFNSYLDILCSQPNKETSDSNVFVEKKIRFFKVYENAENKILKDRFKNFTIHLPSISTNLSPEEREQLAAKLIYDIEKTIENTKRKNIYNTEVDIEEAEIWNYHETKKSEKGGASKTIYNIWEELTKEVKESEALFQPSEEEIRWKQKRNAYFTYIKKKLEAKYQRINHKKRRKDKLNKLNETVHKIVDERYGKHFQGKNASYDDRNVLNHHNYQIIQSGYSPSLIFFHKDLQEEEKKKGIENLCGLHLKEDADRWLLENCLKILKNHETPIPLVICSKGPINLSSTFGIIHIPYNFELKDFFQFLENNVDIVRKIRKRIIDSF